ncbi:nuclear localization sequence binding protein [Recurvomyces mirabilis]|nr:nuclear localization sequence binding protein [Recurvomyces mirabilis]
MAKDKKGSKAAAVAPQVAKPTEKVKAGRVTKPSETAKASSKAASKETAKVVEKKKSKKSKKEPTPEPSSEEEEGDTSDSSASSEDEEETVPAKAVSKINGAAAKDDSSDEDSDDSDDEDEAPPAKAAAPKAKGKANGAVNGKAKAESSDEEDSDDEEDVKAGAVKDTKMADADDDSSDDSEEDDDEAAAKLKPNGEAEEDDDEDDSDDSDDEEEEEKPAAEEKPSKKRKAEAETQSTPKRSKIMIDGEMKDATNNLFVGQLSWNMDEEWLTREFEEFGELTGVRIITDRDSGRSKGFGYIEFKEVESAIAAVEAKNGTELDGRNIRLDFSQPRAERDNNQTPQQKGAARAQQYGDTPKEPSSTLFVGNVSFEADENMVTEMFSEYGTIKAVRLPTDRDTGALKGFGYVEMSSIDEATAAFEAVQGADLAGRPVRLDYASARPDNGGSGGRGGFGDRGGRGGRGGFDRGGRGGGRGRGGFGDRGGRGGGRGRGGFGDRGGRGGGRGGTTNRGGFGDFSGKKMTF